MQSGLSGGADCVVQSSHKTLSALTQAAMLHVTGARLDRGRISQALQLLQVCVLRRERHSAQPTLYMCNRSKQSSTTSSLHGQASL